MKKLENNEIVQICIVVDDLDAALGQYAALFGIERPAVRTLPPPTEMKTATRGRPCRSAARFSSFPMGAVTLELFEPDGEDSVWQEFKREHGTGVCYLGLSTGDSGGALALLREHGFEAVHRGESARSSYTVVDTQRELGVMLNIKQRPKA